MIYFMFKNAIALIYLSTSIVTVLKFPTQIIDCDYGKSKTEIYSRIASDGRSVLIQARTPQVNTNIICYSINNTYNFFVSVDNKKAHQLINIKNGIFNKKDKLVYKSKKIKIFEGQNHLRVKNLLKKRIKVNEFYAYPKKSIYVPKGPPVIVGGKEIIR